jgi:putative transposase
MPRQPREVSPTGIYHVMVRGIAKMDLFPSVADKSRYMITLQKYKDLIEIKIYAYCLMDNHVHLLLREKENNLATVMKRINISFSQYFNKRYSRVGHVFQNRYRSDPIEDETHFLHCARYIHNNPVKAGLVQAPANYLWSSYGIYLAGAPNNLVDTGPLLGCYASSRQQALIALRDFTEKDQSRLYSFSEVEEERDQDRQDQIRKSVRAVLARYGARRMDSIPGVQRREVLQAIKAETDGSLREIAAVLDVSKDILWRA